MDLFPDNDGPLNGPIQEENRADRFSLMRDIRFEPSIHLSGDGHNGGEDRQKGTGLGVNVSTGGLCMLMEWAPVVGEVMRVHVPMPVTVVETPTLAEVRWVRSLPWREDDQYAVGLKFLL